MTLRTLALLLLLSTIGCAPEAKVVEGQIAAQINRGLDQGEQKKAEKAPTFDHSALDALLKATANPETGRVDYAALKARSAELDGYITKISEVSVETLGRDEQLALFINAYNAFTLRLILNHYPGVKSIRDLDKPWDTKSWNVGGQTLSLNDIEHGILRPIFLDERIHFAVNCASVGCPPLADFAFTGAEVEAQLDRVTRSTLRDPRYVAADGDSLKLTRILDWYGKDFTDHKYKGHADTLPNWVARYADDAIVTLITTKSGKPDVSFFEYDWNLNDIQR